MCAEMDWLGSSADARIEPTKALYRALRAVSDVTEHSFDVLMKDIFGSAYNAETADSSNFRKGKLAATKAKLIYHWLGQNHFETAHIIAPDLFQVNPVSAWQRFVDRHAQTGKLRLLRMDAKMGLIRRASERKPVDQTLRMTEEFCFEVQTDLRGVALAFERYQDTWHAVPLGADQRRLKGDVKDSPQILPVTANGEPIPLCEVEDTGDHVFVFVVSSDKKLPHEMRDLAWLSDQSAPFEVHLVAVTFVT